jgi:hypothetical protein
MRMDLPSEIRSGVISITMVISTSGLIITITEGLSFTRIMGIEPLRISFRPQGLGQREISMDLHGLTLIMTVIWIYPLLRELRVASHSARSGTSLMNI